MLSEELIKSTPIKRTKQAGAELGQAQIKLELGFSLIILLQDWVLSVKLQFK